MRKNLNTSFGLMISLVSLAYALGSWQSSGISIALIVPVGVGLLFAFIALFRASWLAPLALLWLKFGELLGKFFNPLILGAIFFLLITPIAVIARLLGRDELRLKRANVRTYWIDRFPPGPDGSSFKNQF